MFWISHPSFPPVHQKNCEGLNHKEHKEHKGILKLFAVKLAEEKFACHRKNLHPLIEI